jgi:cytochrome bd-type quinol oxidase subunit 1
MGAVGGITGMLAGSLAPGILTGLYALDGPEPPPTFSPVIWGSRQGFLIGLLFGAGVAMLALSCLYFASWRLRMTTRRWMIVVMVVAGLLALQRLVAYLLWYGTTDWGLTG